MPGHVPGWWLPHGAPYLSSRFSEFEVDDTRVDVLDLICDWPNCLNHAHAKWGAVDPERDDLEECFIEAGMGWIADEPEWQMVDRVYDEDGRIEVVWLCPDHVARVSMGDLPFPDGTIWEEVTDGG